MTNRTNTICPPIFDLGGIIIIIAYIHNGLLTGCSKDYTR